MSIDYKTAVENLMKSESSITSVAIIEDNKIIFSTENWDITSDLGLLIASWTSRNPLSLRISDKKYSILQSSKERLIATSKSEGTYLIGARDDERRIIGLIKSDGNKEHAYVEMAKTLLFISSKPHYIEKDIELGAADDLSLGPPVLAWQETLSEIKKLFSRGGIELEKVDEEDIFRRKEERERRKQELEKVSEALEIESEKELATISFKATFKTDYMYTEFQLVQAMLKMKKLLNDKFQIYSPLKINITKKF